MNAKTLLALALLSTLSLQLSTVFAQGTAFTYQGRLNSGGNPANGNYDLRFGVWNAESGGSLVSGTVGTDALAVSNGLFTVTLDFGAGIFTGADRWLEIMVRTNGGASSFDTLTPRQKLTAAPYAITAGTVASGGLPAGTYGNAVTFSNSANNFSGSFNGNGSGLTNVNATALGGMRASNFWQLGGNNVAPGQFLGSTNEQAVEFRANGLHAFRLEPVSMLDGISSNMVNVIGGSLLNFVTPGTRGATIGGGGAADYYGHPYSNSIAADFGVIGGGQQNAVRGYAGFLGAGAYNRVLGDESVVGGGVANTNGGVAAMLGGGIFNSIQTNTFTSVIGGGSNNLILAGAAGATIAGGQENISGGNSGTIGGGSRNTVVGNYPTVGGGQQNTGGGDWASIGGGHMNVSGGTASVIAGGENNISGERAFVGGGVQNNSALYSAIAGGAQNSSVNYGFIGGGENNSSGGDHGAVAGGANNLANGPFSFVGGGRANRANGFLSVVGGGGGPGFDDFNEAADFSTVAGGSANRALGFASVVAGGQRNRASGPNTSTGGGAFNESSGMFATVSGGVTNIASGMSATVSGGATNVASGNAATVGGGQSNKANDNYSTVAGGWQNTAEAEQGFAVLFTTVGGGAQNISSGYGATISGGQLNASRGQYSAVGGGVSNVASNDYTTVAGGVANFATNSRATVGGGELNVSGGRHATVPGGELNAAIGHYSFAAGRRAKALYDGSFVWADSQNSDFASTANNQFAVRAGGGCFFDSLIGIRTRSPGAQLDVAAAQGTGRFTATNNLNGGVLTLRNTSPAVTYLGAVNFETSSGTPGQIGYLGNDTMIFRAGGIQRVSLDGSGNLSFGSQTRQMLNLWSTEYGIGVQAATEYFRSGSDFSWFKGGVHNDASHNPGAGGLEMMRLDASGNLNVRGNVIATSAILTSDRNAKENFKPVDGRAVLDKVAALPVSEWNFKSESGTRHIGPMAQDFYAAFKVGEDDRHIAVVDEGGVALAAIQGLNQKIEARLAEKDSEIAQLKRDLAELRNLLRSLRRDVAATPQ